MLPRLKEVDVRLRLIAPVLLVLAATAGVFVLTRTDSTAEAWFVLATGLALAAVTATAISNARTRHSLALLVEEQAALRRVATLVARESPPVEIFGAVTEEACRVLESEVVGLLRFEPDGAATLVAQSDSLWDPPPPGTRLRLDGENVVAEVLRTGEVARVDDWSGSTGSVAAMASALGVRSAVASPVVVEGAPWGTIIVATSRSKPLPADTESRIAQFTGLVATAIANAAARGALSRLADEQAALRRVATVVARGVGPEGVFRAVADEVGAIFAADVAAIVRFEEDRTVTVLGDVGGPHESGKRVSLDEGYVVHRVRETGRSARFDTDDPSAADMPSLVRALGIRSSVASPIVVEGELWGAITAASLEGALPSSAERRLTEFTELVATAVANTQAREQIAALAEEQAALRRVATLVAESAPAGDLFRAVTLEVGMLLDADFAGMARLDGEVSPLAAWAAEGEHPPLPDRWPMQPGDPVTAIAESQRAVRWDDWSAFPGPIAAFIRDELGVRSTVGTPIVVDGQLWGVLAVHARRPLPQDSVSRLEQFSDLVATAIGDAETRAEVARLADEQAALRRIATLVAGGAVPEQVFAAVTEEIAAIFDAVTAVMRFEHDPPGKVMVGLSEEGGIPIGTRWPLGEGVLSTEVYRTGRSARFGPLEAADRGPVPGAGFRFGVPSQVAGPIVVQGGLWGVITLNAARELPPDTEQRLENFIELVTTAIANAEADIALRAAAEEQGALRRVATLVAASAAPSDVFAAVTEEIALVLGADVTLLCRADPDGAAVVVGAWADNTSAPALGTRISRGGTNLTTIVLETGHPARIDGYDEATGTASDVARTHGLRSAVGAPILVEGRLWGLVVAGTSCDEPLPPDAEAHLAGFTDLVATAIANAESRQARAALTDEQAALRRVATLVAESPESEELFSAVAHEVASVLDVRGVIVDRFEPDGSQVTLGSAYDRELAGAEAFLGAGVRLPLRPGTLAAGVFETRRAARVEDYSKVEGRMGDAARAAGLGPGCAAPIMVDGRLWGQMCAFSAEGTVLPAGMEHQLDDFVKLVATAISNYDSRARLRTVAEEQAALRRVATLVARRVAPEEVFRAVADEAGRLLGAEVSALVRLESDNTVTVVAGPPPGPHSPGERLTIDPGFVVEAVRETGRPARFETDDPAGEGMPDIVRRLGVRSAVASPIVVEGALWGAVILGSLDASFPPETEQRLDEFTELVATGISNATARAELVASRARIVAAADQARRRIERNLHDGTQQRLVSLGLAVRAAEAGLPPDRDDLRTQLSGVASGLVAAVEDLQEISRGIHPAILSRGGLAPALRTLAHRSVIPVDLDVVADVRLAEPIEVAAYFVASEALANAAKHSQASRIDVSVEQRDGRLWLSVRDDGVGGADAAHGSGLIGLTDRVEALGGSLRVSSRPGDGTQIRAELPLELELSPTAN
jgi:GAF domain-containing protein